MPAHLADRGSDMREVVAANDQRTRVCLHRRTHLDSIERPQGVVLAEACGWEGWERRGGGCPNRGGEVLLRKDSALRLRTGRQVLSEIL